MRFVVQYTRNGIQAERIFDVRGFRLGPGSQAVQSAARQVAGPVATIQRIEASSALS